MTAPQDLPPAEPATEARVAQLDGPALALLVEDLNATWNFDEQQADPIHQSTTPKAVLREVARRLRATPAADALRDRFEAWCRLHCSPRAEGSEWYWQVFKAGAEAATPAEPKEKP